MTDSPSPCPLKNDIDPVFQPYANIYEKEVRSFENITIKFGDTELPNSVGLCHGYIDYPGGIITIKKEYWDKSTEGSRLNVILHELGHCAGKMSHVPGKVLYENSLVAISIMNPVVFDLDKFPELKGAYIEALKYQNTILPGYSTVYETEGEPQ